MAEKKEDVDASQEASGGKSKMMIIIAVVVIALAAGGYFFLMGGDEEAPEDDAKGEKKEATPVKQSAIYYSLEKPLIVNFAKQSGGAARYLSVDLKIMARDQETIDAFTLHTPAMKHYLLLLFFAQNYDELNTNKGVSNLKKLSLSVINEVLKNENHDGEVEAVYFPKLLMQ